MTRCHGSLTLKLNLILMSVAYVRYVSVGCKITENENYMLQSLNGLHTGLITNLRSRSAFLYGILHRSHYAGGPQHMHSLRP